MADRDIPEETVEKAARELFGGPHHRVRADGGEYTVTWDESEEAGPFGRAVYRGQARRVLSAALAGRTVVDTRPDDLDPEALNAVANAVHDHYGFVRLDVRYEAAAAAIRIVEAWQATPIPGASGSGVGDQP
ncbi:MAG: hypothetical protein WBA97_34965 [Actinophytocola sp.]|uniref:hypothetical protein n=1 Tax=Actinophytocola sp. TaxID=1872138 RepID=UPI003C776B5D